MKIGVVCYDAGGGELLSSYVKLNDGNYFYSIMGPSIDIFKRKLKVFKNDTLDQIIPKIDLLICGTSAKSNHELDALKMAKGIKTICFLDHWTNYSERFLRAGIYTFPDDFWVTDKYAFDLFKKTFPKKKCVLVENPYLKDCKRQHDILKLNKKKISIYKNILILSQKSEPNYFNNFLEYLKENKKYYQLIIRPHPAEKLKSFNWIKKFKFEKVRIETTKSLVENIYESDYIVGCSTMALVVALYLKKEVFYFSNQNSNVYKLPHKGIRDIKHLKDIL